MSQSHRLIEFLFLLQEHFRLAALIYFPEIHLAKHMGSMFTIRVVPPRVENTDARPTIVKKISENVISMFSGKITTCVDAAKEVEEIIKND